MTSQFTFSTHTFGIILLIDSGCCVLSSQIFYILNLNVLVKL